MTSVQTLINGYHLFRKKYFNRYNKKYPNLVKYGQRPKCFVIACSDSRVDPAILMNCEPGDLFVVRNVANLVPPFAVENNGYHGTSAALEFGICVLGIQQIIILGHTMCSGIASLIERNPNLLRKGSLIKSWMNLAASAYQDTIANYSDATNAQQIVKCGQYALINSLKNIMTFPWIIERVQAGNLAIHLWNFDLATGLIEAYDSADGTFKVMF